MSSTFLDSRSRLPNIQSSEYPFSSEKSKNIGSIPVLFEISDEFLEFCGLWIGDGSYDAYNGNVVIVSNVDEECREVIKNIASYTH